MDVAAASPAEVPLVSHSKEEDVPSMIPHFPQKNPRKRKFDEKENLEIPKRAKRNVQQANPIKNAQKLKRPTESDAQRVSSRSPRKRRSINEEAEDQETSSADSAKAAPRKVMKLKSLQDKAECGTPKRATRTQKRVQLKQLFEGSPDDDSKAGNAATGEKKKSGAKQKAKQKSVKYLLSSTDVWGTTEAVPSDVQPTEEWREINLDVIDPLELIGRSCKVFWPLDQSWYLGDVHEYSSVSKKHRIDYSDNQMEWLSLTKEKVQFQMSIEEEKKLSSPLPVSASKVTLAVDELVLLAHEQENCEDQIGHGTVVWAKVKGWPVWPAIVLDNEHAAKCGLELPRKLSFAMQFFGSCDFARLNADKVVTFAKGVQLKYHLKCKRPAFEQGMREVERYLREGRLPEKMAQMVEIQSKRKSEKDFDAEEFIGDERQRPAGKKSMVELLGCPLDLGDLIVLSLGKIVDDSDHFHDKHHIWPEGYSSVREFPSMKDDQKVVDYQMEVIRNPSTPSLPLFRVIPADSEPIEGLTPDECWQEIYNRLEATKKVKRKSGMSMFGLSHSRVLKLIQTLSRAKACDSVPKGYKPIDLQWKHSERCNVCYLDEEYVDNIFLQCAKCRLMVHMTCYGEAETSSDDLWLCQLCQRSVKKAPICSLCPVTGGAMKKTTCGGWSHLTCAMWIPEICILDVKKMEPVDGLGSVSKERWKLRCCVCEVPYGACIQCAHPQCMVSFHPLCARAAGFCMKVFESAKGALKLVSFCPKHRTDDAGAKAKTICASPQTLEPESSSYSGCSRCQPYSFELRRKSRQEPEAQTKAVLRRTFVEKTAYLVGGLRSSSRWRLKIVGNVYKSILPTSSASIELSEVVSMSVRLENMRSTMHSRLTFGKSGIHGWGIFSKQPHQAGDMVVEYAGELVRRSIADLREHRHYNSIVGAGTYMFKIDEERVVDATRAGNIAQLINHSCEPNCYSRIVTINGEDLIIIFAKRDIRAGEELTYDYRFSSKGEELVCNCGASNCRGSVQCANAEDGDGDGRIRVPCSQLVEWRATQP